MAGELDYRDCLAKAGQLLRTAEPSLPNAEWDTNRLAAAEAWAAVAQADATVAHLEWLRGGLVAGHEVGELAQQFVEAAHVAIEAHDPDARGLLSAALTHAAALGFYRKDGT